MNKTVHQELSRLGSLIDLIYAGATEMTAWHKVPREISDWMGALTCMIFTPLHTPEHGGFTVTHNMSPQTMELWATKYHAHDIWAQRAVERGLAITGEVLRDQDLVTEEEFLASTVYKEFLAPLRMGRVLSGIVFSGGDNQQLPVVCACHRPFSEPYTESDADKLRLLLPHISRALGVMFRLRDAEFKVASSLAALDRLPNGILLFDAEGRVTFANQAAGHILEQEDGLRLGSRPGRREAADLLAFGNRAQGVLDDAIREAISPDIFSTRHFTRTLSIHRPSGRAPYALNFSTLPVQNEFGLGASVPRAIAFLTDSVSAIRLNSNLLKSAYGLTEAENKVAEQIVKGGTIEEVAQQLGVSVNTIKTQLAQIYDKTNTHSRAKLVKLLMTLTVVE